jgi:hypothetical protein
MGDKVLGARLRVQGHIISITHEEMGLFHRCDFYFVGELFAFRKAEALARAARQRSTFGWTRTLLFAELMMIIAQQESPVVWQWWSSLAWA